MTTIAAKQGQRLTFNMNVADVSGSTIDLSGFTASLKIMTPDRQATHNAFTSEAGNITLSASNPNVQVAINSEVTDLWDWQHAKGDLELTRTADGQVIYSVPLLFIVEKSFS